MSRLYRYIALACYWRDDSRVVEWTLSCGTQMNLVHEGLLKAMPMRITREHS